MTEISKIVRKINRNKFSELFDHKQQTALRHVTTLGNLFIKK
jgi:hypothetical protein